MYRLLIVLIALLFVAVPVKGASPNDVATPAATMSATPASTETATSNPSSLKLTGVIVPIHDPTLVKDGAKYYVVSTGQGIPIHCSTDMLEWSICGRVFRVVPFWVYQEIPKVTDLWAPDLVYWNGKWHLYYAASSFGSNRSAIGLATNVTLDQDRPDYHWVDEGEVIASQTTDNFNAIDPNLVTDQDGQRWLVFGSFWSGINMRRIDSATGKPVTDDKTLYALAFRPGNPAIEGAYITHHGDYYYLFASIDFCCRGVDSTYKIIVGRSKHITGPYVDRHGVAMMNGGGNLVYAGTDRWRGPGHNMVYVENGVYYMVYHAYDAEKSGAPTLQIDKLDWDQDWPVLAK